MRQHSGTVERPDRDGEVAATLVLPCLNEERAIALVVRRARHGFARLGIEAEILVVDNGSTDGSVAEALRAGARVVHEARRGYGSALKRGFLEARGRYIMMADADDTYPVDNFGPFIELLDAGCDMVNGDRFGGGIQPGAMTWSHQYLGTPVLSWILRWFTGASLRDSQCGMRAFRREALERLDLRAPGMEFASEMLVKAARAGLNLGEVPITLAPRIGDSKLQTLPDGWRHLRYLLVASPNHLFLMLGMVLFAGGLGMLGLQAVAPLGLPIGAGRWKPEYASVILAAVGGQILWFGLLAKIYYTTIGLITKDGVVDWFLKVFSLERALALSVGLIGLGLGIEVALGLQQLALIGPMPALGAAGTFAILIGVESFFGSFMAYLLSSEYTRPMVRARNGTERDRVVGAFPERLIPERSAA